MDERRVNTVSIKVSKKELAILNQYCEFLGVSKSDFLRGLIHKELFDND